MLDTVRNAVRSLAVPKPTTITWRKQDAGWLPTALFPPFPKAPGKSLIEELASKTNRKGAQPLHEAYGQKDAIRCPDEVRSSSYAGDLYAWLAQKRRPSVIVEFGAAFGVSGMYWLAGLEAARKGHLYSFEINPGWAAIARENMGAISDRFTLTVGSFEEHIDRVLEGQPIDVAFVDGIHTMDFIVSQFKVLLRKASPGAVLLFDDIDFSTGRMEEGWSEIWRSTEVAAACEVNGRTGIVELS